MKKVKLKLSYEELDTLLSLLQTQVIHGESYKRINPTKDYVAIVPFVVGHVSEFYLKQYQKTCFAYTGSKTINIHPLQAYALKYVIENGWLSSDNKWTRTLLQLYFERLHKQLL